MLQRLVGSSGVPDGSGEFRFRGQLQLRLFNCLLHKATSHKNAGKLRFQHCTWYKSSVHGMGHIRPQLTTGAVAKFSKFGRFFKIFWDSKLTCKYVSPLNQPRTQTKLCDIQVYKALASVIPFEVCLVRTHRQGEQSLSLNGPWMSPL